MPRSINLPCSLEVLTAPDHAKPGDNGTDWRLLARTAKQAKFTLVIYMGVNSAMQIQNDLLTGLEATSVSQTGLRQRA